MKREQLILPESLRDSRSTGVLDTPEKVRAAAEELRESVKDAFERIRISQMRAIIEARHCFICDGQ